jgi:hypothetical protein
MAIKGIRQICESLIYESKNKIKILSWGVSFPKKGV